MKPNILLYSKDYDEFVNHVIDYLVDHSFVRIGIDNTIQLESFILENINNNSATINTEYKSQVDLFDIKSIWFNGGGFGYQPKDVSPELNQLLSDNFKLVLNGVISGVDLKTIGSLKNTQDSNKVKNLLVASGCCLVIPSTLITSEKEKLIDFMNSCDNEIVCKRINDADKFFEGAYLYDNSKTFVVTDDIITTLPERFEFSLFQERIYKEYEVRVILFDNKFYACAIFDTTNALDYRTNLGSSKAKPRIVPYRLPKEIENKLRKLTGKLGYEFCSIDLMYSITGDYVFLEINPCGQISFINNACNYYLEKSFAEFLKN